MKNRDSLNRHIERHVRIRLVRTAWVENIVTLCRIAQQSPLVALDVFVDVDLQQTRHRAADNLVTAADCFIAITATCRRAVITCVHCCTEGKPKSKFFAVREGSRRKN